MRFLFANGFLVIVFLIVSNCGRGPSKQVIFGKLSTVQQRLQAIEAKASADDKEAFEILNSCNQRLKNVQDFIIEDEFRRAGLILDELSFRLDDYQSEKSEPSQDQNRNIEDIGNVEFRTAGDNNYRKFSGKEELKGIGAFRTGIRSAVILNTIGRTIITLQAQTEVEILSYDEEKRKLSMRLLEGTLAIKKRKSGSEIELELNNTLLVLQRGAFLEAANFALTDYHYVAVYQGSATWRENGDEGQLGKYTGLKWAQGRRSQVDVPVKPIVDAPENNEVFFTGDESTQVALRWHSSSYIPQYHVQISRHSQFVTRVFDKKGITAGGIEIELAPGEYFWRMRGYGDENLPGPFTRIMGFGVRKGFVDDKKTADEQASKADKAGPVISGLSFQVLHTMVIISGSTSKHARVNVNGVGAVMLAEGNFRAIVNFSDEGTQIVRVIATDKTTGVETIVERNVQIKY